LGAESYHAAVSDDVEILVGFSSYGNLGSADPSDWTLTFWLRYENDKFQKVESREVKRDGDRFFLVTLPSGEVSRSRLKQSGSFDWVDSIPGE
jgi:hypothetical protein